MKLLLCLGLVSALLSPALAQTFTSCNPLNETNCPSDQALGMNKTFDFSQTLDGDVWNQTAGSLTYGSGGAAFTMNRKGDSPTVQSTFYLFFGVVEVIMKAATGTGVISSIVLESDDLDEVDWEWMGGNHTHVETNYFGKGNTTSFDRAVYYPVDRPQDKYHNYTTIWTSDKIEWLVDSNVVRTLPYGDANGGKNFPQTPMNIRLGVWAGGDPGNPKGTIEWAGGVVDYNGGPYTMVVQSVRATDYSKGATYTYGDKTGSWESIKVASGNSTIKEKINAPPPESVSQKFNDLSSTAKIAIFAGVGTALALTICLLTCCCIKQRRAGRRERIVEEAKMNALLRDNNTYEKPYAGAGMLSPNPPMYSSNRFGDAAGPSQSRFS